nr:NupC/NupG family nucleoside CNT transporter [Nocardioides daedukensis]
MDVLWGLGGMAVVLAIAVLFSVDRRRIRFRTVSIALALQVGFGVLVLFVPWGKTALNKASSGVQAVIDSSADGIAFLFGPIIPKEGTGTIFAFQVLPVIVFVASLTAVLYHLGILQMVVRFVGGGLSKLLGTTETESMNAAANIFVGQTEAPLVIKPYIAGLSRSELFAVMAGGLSTVAGSVLVGYSLLGARLDYLIAASFMAAPGALLMAKILVPAGALEGAGRDTAEKETTETDGEGTAGSTGPDAPVAEKDEEEPPTNVLDAAARGAGDGLKLAANVGAMLLAFISLIALGNLILGGVGGWFGQDDLSIEQILGYVFAPVMFAVGVPWHEALDAGSFLGQKIVLNEFVAFADFAPQAGEFSEKSRAVITFALTGFANLGSLAILLGGLGGIAPTQRSRIAELGLRAVLAGTLANLMSAAIAGVLVG